ncbi:MAG: threonine/serine exporter family protein [Stomatobaculum sp.]|nr:threonine/serine exporter family protein [Stomatobaculum sp.]
MKKEVLDTAARAGRMLLENGAEISRVEESMERICRSYGTGEESFYVLSNGLFLTAEDEDGSSYALAEHIPLSAVRMDRIEALNTLSRDIEHGKYTPREANDVMDRIADMPEKHALHQALASGVGAAAFCCLPGGSLKDTLTAFLAGILLQFFLAGPGKHLSKASSIILGSALVSAVCCLSYCCSFGKAMNYMMIGSVMPLIPGVGFVVSIHDIVEGDYLSGFIRLLDALLVFFCIALGVAVTLSAAANLMGGELL